METNIMNKSGLQKRTLLLVLFGILQITNIRCYSQDDSFNYIEPTDAGPGNFGLKLGYGSAGASELPESSDVPAFNLSFYFTMNPLAGKIVEFSQELGYVSKGLGLNLLNTPYPEEKKFSLGYAELNNIIKIKPLKTKVAPFVFIGFYVSALVSGGDNLNQFISDEYYNNNSMDAPVCKFIDYGYNYGIGIDFGKMKHGKNERWGGVDVRVSKGLTSILEGDDVSEDMKNQVTMAVFRVFLFNL